jgi:DNA-binding transcriptional LysR family regulator
LELHQIRYFLALTRSLNFTRAAEMCNVTQPALTKAVHKLELELGGMLIHRERQLTQLTDLGKLVLPMLERAYVAAESVHTLAVEFQRKEIAPLKIALAPCVSAAIVEAPLIEIARFMPGLEVELVEEEPTALSELLLDGTVNAAICGDELGELPVRIDHWSLFEERFLVLMPRESPLAEFAALPTDVLAKATWLERVGRVGCQGANQLWQGLFPSGVEPQIGHRGRRFAHLQHMVAAGLGLMLWPEHAPHLPHLVTRPIANDPLRRNIQLLAVAGRRYSPALEALVKITRVHDWSGGFPVAEGPVATAELRDPPGFQDEAVRLATAGRLA